MIQLMGANSSIDDPLRQGGSEEGPHSEPAVLKALPALNFLSFPARVSYKPTVLSSHRSLVWRRVIGTLLALVLQCVPSAVRGAERPLLLLADHDYPPIAYLDNGEPKGMDVDLARALAAAMKREIRIELMDWNLAQQKVLQGEADGLLGMSISKERRQLYDFASATFPREFGLLVRKGDMTIRTVNDLKGKRVGVTSGGFPRQFLESQAGIHLVVIGSYQSGFDQLTAGSVNALAVDLWVAAYLLEKSGTRGVTIVGKPFATTQSAIAVKKGHTALLQELNQGIAALKAEGKVLEIQESWQPQEMLFLSRERVRGTITLAVGGVALLVLGGMAVWIVTLKRQIRSRRQAEAAAREASERLREIFDHTTDAVFLIRVMPEGRFVYESINPAAARVSGYGPGTVNGRSPEDFMPASLAAELNARYRACLDAGTTIHYEQTLEFAPGRRTFDIFLVPLRDATGHIHRLAGFARDVTEQQRAQSGLRDSETRLRTLTDASFEGIAVCEDGILADANDQLITMLGYRRAEFIGKPVVDLVAPESRELVKRMTESAFGESYEHLAIRQDGTIFPVEVRGRNIAFTPRRVRVTTVRDMTARKAAEQSLRESEERYRNFITLSGEGIARIDFEPPIPVTLPTPELVTAIVERGFIAECNDAAARMRGWQEAREMQGKPVRELIQATEPDNRLNLAQFVGAGFKAVETLTIGRDVRGEIRYFLNNAVGIVQSGQLRHLWTVQRDITENKHAEEALRENERKLATLLSNLPGLTYRCRNDPQWTMEFVSDGCRELTGYAPADLQDNHRLSYADLIDPDDQARVWQTVQAGLAARSPFELTYRIRTATGSVKWVWERGQGVFAGDGAVIALEGFITDITARRQAELEREQAVQREHRAQEEYTRQLIASQEAERRRIAGELHDSLGQNLLLLKNQAQLALGCPGIDATLREQIEGMKESATQAIAEVRQISQDLHPYQIEHLGLTRALAGMLENVARSTSLAVVHRLDSVDEVFQGDSAANLYRVVQEALNNVLKHSGAKRVEVRLEHDIHHVRLWIADDGEGFAVPSTGVQPAGLGLKNIAERVRILGGTLTVDSQPGGGTRLEVLFPSPGP
jgi:PAS domain S-box-containing protein